MRRGRVPVSQGVVSLRTSYDFTDASELQRRRDWHPAAPSKDEQAHHPFVKIAATSRRTREAEQPSRALLDRAEQLELSE